MIKIDNPNDLPEPTLIKKLEEPYVHATLMMPKEYIGSIMEICQFRRGTYVSMSYIDDNRVSLLYDLPLSEIVYDFFDKIKSTSRGYASFDYELADYRESNLVKLDILLNGEKVDSISNSQMGSLTLVAKWESVNYDIAYELNGGSTNEAFIYQYSSINNAPIALPVLTLVNHQFNG